ncbi:hypothetical protein G7Y29_07100 [Corynebacterium qintianiae]|uniref:Nuclear transport factor 2 family protein n=1 Tax=Corynebacterium qintianiae TaxID=2709392 RepID=A0A7T0PDZ0_9CORY|nr:hypothetical protein [Corynebacterium qintianiae]QPK82651.1 hypothetical protein G7Y29_07100 [Corynebacterium qintianiae]
MKFSTGARTVSAVSTVAFALSLTACGSDKDDTTVVNATATETSTHTSTSSAQEPAPSVSPTDEPTTAGDKPQDPAAGAAAAGATLSNPFEDPNFQPPNHEPLQSGTAGTEADRQQMQDTMYASLNPPSPEKWTRVLLENSCRKVTEPAQEEMKRSGYTLDQIEQAARMQAQAGQGISLPKSDVSVTDVKIDGNRASANATVTNENGTDTQVQIFEREDGRWKLCS